MKSTSRHVAVLVAVPDRRIGRTLAKAALQSRLCACAQIIPGIESHYWWKDRLESAHELLLIFKTTRARLAALEARVHELHPYEVPQFTVLPVSGASKAYLDWIDTETAPLRLRRTPG